MLIEPAPDEANTNKPPVTAIFLKNNSWAINAASTGAAQKAIENRKAFMDKQEFLELLEEKKFPDPTLVEQEPNKGLDLHRHDFEVYALVVEGSIEIDIEGVKSTYGINDVFHLVFQPPHSEKYGPIGVKYLANRKSSWFFPSNS